MNWLLVLGIAFNPPTYFHLMEVNHHYSLDGLHVYSQVILWHLNPATGRPEVGHWGLIDQDGTHPRQQNGIFVWNTGKHRVYSRLYRESWTQDDPERKNKRYLAEEDRIGLPVPPKEPPPN
jgi:hypothetical protein